VVTFVKIVAVDETAFGEYRDLWVCGGFGFSWSVFHLLITT